MNRPSPRWLAIPALLAVLALIGLALSTEDRSQFEERARAGDGRTGDGQSEDGRGDGARQRDGSADRGDSGRSGSGGQGSGSGSGSGSGVVDRLVISTGDGEIVVEVDGNGRPARVVSGRSSDAVGDDRVFTPDADGNVVGLRVTDEGRLEPVERGDLRADDLVTRPGPDGAVEVVRPDGTRVELEATDDGGLAGTEIAPDGSRRDLRADGGDIVVQPGSDLRPGIEIDPTSEPIVMGGDSGPVRLDLEPNGDLVADQPIDDPGISLDGLEDAEEFAIRVNEDGSIELVPADEIGPDDTVLVPTDDGIDLVRPDGSRVEFRPDGEAGGITATEIGPGGEVTELTPNPDGSVTLSDGTTVGPIDFAEDGGVMEQLIDRTSNLPWPWVAGGIGLLALLSIATAVYLHRNRPPDEIEFTELVSSDRFEDFLAVLARDPDPTRAIRLAFHTVERGIAGLPTRRADETPFEWHRRVEAVRPDLAEPLAPICDLFALARFAPGQATEDDRSKVIEALRRLYTIAGRTDGRRYPDAGSGGRSDLDDALAGSGWARR